MEHHLPFCLSNVISKKNEQDEEIFNWPLKNFIDNHETLKVQGIDCHYRSSSYNKKNRNSMEKEIIVLHEE